MKKLYLVLFLAILLVGVVNTAYWVDGTSEAFSSGSSGAHIDDFTITFNTNVTGYISAVGMRAGGGSSDSNFQVHVNQSGTNIASKIVSIPAVAAFTYFNFTMLDYSTPLTEGIFTIDIHRTTGDITLSRLTGVDFIGETFNFSAQTVQTGYSAILGDSFVLTQTTLTNSIPELTLNSPMNDTNSSSRTFNFNATIYDDLNVTNVSLYLDGALNETNSSGVNGTYVFTKTVSTGTHNWSILAFDNNSASNQSETRFFTSDMVFILCNSTYSVPFLNITFQDESDLSELNATIPASNFVYYTENYGVSQTYEFINNTENDYYAFCAFPPNELFYVDARIQYASIGYPQRVYNPAVVEYTNITTNQTLYLLSSADGIYSTIQVVDQDGDKISDIEVVAERQFSGVWTIIGQEITDDAGLVTFWLNPDYDHKFTFVGDSCTGITVTIRPTQTQYTQQLQCGVSADIYVSQIEGIKYSRRPGTGIIQAGTYNFSYQIVSSKDNLVNVSMQLVNSSDGSVLNSTWSACNPGGCTIYVIHEIDFGEDIKGKYYFDIGNGSVLLEGDARWRAIDIDTAGKAGIRTFIRDMKYVIDEWGDDSDTADFNRLVIVFFFMALGISALNYQFGNDTQNPGAFLVVMTLVILMGSLSGSFVGGEMTGQGFFYYNNLSGSDFLNNYILAGFTLVITISYFINVNRRAQQ